MSDSAVAGSEQEIQSEMDPIVQQGSLNVDLDFITPFSFCHSRPNRRGVLGIWAGKENFGK